MMFHKILITSCLAIMLAVMACGSVSVVPETSAPPATTAASLPSTLAPALGSVPSTATPQSKGSWEQPLWSNPDSESDTLLVTLKSTQGQLEEGESTVITASANNMSDDPIDVNLITRLGAGLMVSSSTGCTGDPCSTGRRSVAPGQQSSSSIHVTLESGAVRDRYELVLNYEYTAPISGERTTGRIDGELTSGDYAPTPTPYPTYTPFPTPTFTPHPTKTPTPTYTP